MCAREVVSSSQIATLNIKHHPFKNNIFVYYNTKKHIFWIVLLKIQNIFCVKNNMIHAGIKIKKKRVVSYSCNAEYTKEDMFSHTTRKERL